MENIKKDIQFLTESLEHRQSATEQEERAANYVLERLRPFVDDAHRTSFGVVENFRLVMAAYYGEFVVTCVIAFWWPTVALCYGFLIFFAYMAEFIGYPVFSRLLAYYESTSVVGFKEGGDTDRLLVFTAYLDTDNNPVSSASGLPFIRRFHRLIMIGMVLVLATCCIDAYGAYLGAVNPLTGWIRMGCLVFFTLTATAVFIASFGGDASQGANHNASGIAALLEIAERLCKNPVKKASVLFYVSGGHFANMAGMRSLIGEITALKKETYIINLEGVGAGDLCYTEAEGMLFRAPCSKRLIQAATGCAESFKARSARVHDFATNAYLPLLRGMNVISLIGLDEQNLPVNYGAEEDTRMSLDSRAVFNAACFAEALGRSVIDEHEKKEG